MKNTTGPIRTSTLTKISTLKKTSGAKNSRCRGFTLIEVLIVVGIFAVLSSISFTTLSQYINATEKLAKNDQEVRRLQKTFTLLERDLRYLVPRSVRDEYSDTESAFLVNYANGLHGEQIRFTTIHPDYAIPGSGKLQRVAWRVDNNELYRDNWNALDRDSETELNSLLVMELVESLEVEQFSWSDDFGLQQGSQFDDENQFPFGIKLTLILTDGKTYERLFDLANGS